MRLPNCSPLPCRRRRRRSVAVQAAAQAALGVGCLNRQGQRSPKVALRIPKAGRHQAAKPVQRAGGRRRHLRLARPALQPAAAAAVLGSQLVHYAVRLLRCQAQARKSVLNAFDSLLPSGLACRCLGVTLRPSSAAAATAAAAGLRYSSCTSCRCSDVCCRRLGASRRGRRLRAGGLAGGLHELQASVACSTTRQAGEAASVLCAWRAPPPKHSTVRQPGRLRCAHLLLAAWPRRACVPGTAATTLGPPPWSIAPGVGGGVAGDAGPAHELWAAGQGSSAARCMAAAQASPHAARACARLRKPARSAAPSASCSSRYSCGGGGCRCRGDSRAVGGCAGRSGWAVRQMDARRGGLVVAHGCVAPGLACVASRAASYSCSRLPDMGAGGLQGGGGCCSGRAAAAMFPPRRRRASQARCSGTDRLMYHKPRGYLTGGSRRRRGGAGRRGGSRDDRGRSACWHGQCVQGLVAILSARGRCFVLYGVERIWGQSRHNACICWLPAPSPDRHMV